MDRNRSIEDLTRSLQDFNRSVNKLVRSIEQMNDISIEKERTRRAEREEERNKSQVLSSLVEERFGTSENLEKERDWEACKRLHPTEQCKPGENHPGLNVVLPEFEENDRHGY